MERMTLIEMVQNILSSMNSDEVNSIGDTVESLQVANEIRNTFNELYSNRDIGTFENLINLESPGDTATPHVLTLPSNVQFIKWIKYRNFRGSSSDSDFKTIDYLAPEDFIQRVVQGTNSGSYDLVTILGTSPVTFPVANNRTPTFYTIFEDSQQLVFDSYDMDEESFLTGSNALAWGVLYKTFLLEDDFIPPIDASLFPHLLAEAKSVCFINVKEVANSKEEQKARRQLVRSQTRVAGATSAQKKRILLDGFDFSRKR